MSFCTEKCPQVRGFRAKCKSLKKHEKSLKKVLTNVVVGGIIVRLSHESAHSGCKYDGFAIAKWRLSKPAKRIWPTSLAKSQGPWKLNSVRQERKHTQYPLILTQYEKNPETRNCFQKRRQRASWVTNSMNWLIQAKACVDTIFWEFDPGSGRTLAACLTHASRTENLRIETSVDWSLFLVADGRVTREQPALQRGTTVGNDC